MSVSRYADGFLKEGGRLAGEELRVVSVEVGSELLKI
jgi:hypothetical protein